MELSQRDFLKISDTLYSLPLFKLWLEGLSCFGFPKLIVWDECHHLAAGSWRAIFEAFPTAFHIGLTATPERLDGKGLGTFFKEMIHGPSVQQLIQDGYLSPYKLYAPMRVSIEGVHTKMGGFCEVRATRSDGQT